LLLIGCGGFLAIFGSTFSRCWLLDHEVLHVNVFFDGKFVNDWTKDVIGVIIIAIISIHSSTASSLLLLESLLDSIDSVESVKFVYNLA